MRTSAVRSATRGIHCAAKVSGVPDTDSFKIDYYKGDAKASPWHHIDLMSSCGNLNMLTEIPKMSKAKMEVDTKAEYNPIVQDTKKGKLRYYHGPIFWNYGCAPQTWEDPSISGGDEVGGAMGDNDPLDLVEIGSAALEMGSVTPVKPIGVLAMLDDGELDWKMVVINTADPLCDQINSIADVERLCPGTVTGIREWFRWYKTPDGKPINAFGYNEECLGADFCKKVIEDTNKHYLDLVAGKADPGKLWLP